MTLIRLLMLAPCFVLSALIAQKAQAQPIDLLLVVDNSNAMAEEQTILVNAIPDLVARLAGADIELDGIPNFTPFTDIQAGIVTTDMGTGGFAIPTCSNSQSGDDGILRTVGAPLPGCSITYPAIQALSGDESAFAQGVSCVAQAGISGCGFEQPLEAGLKAVTPATSQLRFFNDTTGHGDGANAGLVRAESILVVYIISEENDCSAADPDLYNPAGGPYAGTSLNLRCVQHPEALHPTQRLVDGLLALKTDPADIVLVLVGGIPPDLISDPLMPDFAAILADNRMQETVDPNTSQLQTSCTGDAGDAFPPTRGVAAAQALETAGAVVILGSTCDASLQPLNVVIAQAAVARGKARMPFLFSDGFESP